MPRKKKKGKLVSYYLADDVIQMIKRLNVKYKCTKTNIVEKSVRKAYKNEYIKKDIELDN